MRIDFSKYSGAGNDFILIDHRQALFDVEKILTLISPLCDRKNGIGADGVIFLTSSSKADFGMRIFNADGSEAEMCGNGMRCLGKFIHEIGFSKQNLTIETPLSPQKIHYLNIKPNSVEVSFPFSKKITIHSFSELNIEGYYLDTGVPHLVIFVSDIEQLEILKMGAFFRNHPFFSPRGTNVDFASLKNDSILLRTYERGVEGETLACGTGAIATALCASEIYSLSSPIAIGVRSGDELKISFNKDCSLISMEGPAKQSFRGNFHIEDFLAKR